LLSDAAPGTTVIDIGANVGDTAALCRLAGCTLDIVAVEASLSFYKLLAFNIDRCPGLFGSTSAIWAFVGRPDDQAPLHSQGGTASIANKQGTPERLGAVQPPVVSLADLLVQTPSLVKIDVDGYDHVIIENDIATLEKHRPVIWTETQSETISSDADWARLIKKLTAKWPYMMVFDNYGFCVLAGRTADLGATTAELIATCRRYRRAADQGLNAEARLYYFDIAFFPKRFHETYEVFRQQIPELAL